MSGEAADFAVPVLASLADIAEHGAAEYGDAPAFWHADGRRTSYARLAERIRARRAELRLRDCGASVAVRAADPEEAAVELLSAWAEGCVCFLGRAMDAARLAGADVGSDPLLAGAACVLASSGTTGEPKLAVLTRAGVLADLLAGLARYAFAPGARYVSLVPCSHAFGLVCDLLAPLATGGTVCVPSAPAAFLAELARFAPTSLNVPPQVAGMLLDALRARKRAGASVAEARAATCGPALRAMMCGGAGLGAAVTAGLRAFGVEAAGCYGLTECSPCVSINCPRGRADGSAGLPLACNEVRVAPDGQILVRGANVMAGYLGRPDLTAQVLWPDGWLRTRDVGRLDARGLLWVDGRADALVALPDGTLVSPEAWERTLCELPGVRQALVRGVRDEGAGTSGPARGLAATVVVGADMPAAARAELEARARRVSPDGAHLLGRVDVTDRPLACGALGKARR